jgi:bifunctional DNA-binding transcriptional regulator/antitoxin component of YhaV-PrlF toxin-antitoxin module
VAAMSVDVVLPMIAGETTITGKNQISLPARAVRALGWERGDRLLVEVFGQDMLLLMKRPDSWTDALAGTLTGVFGAHTEVLRYLDEERRSWEPERTG